MLIIAQHHDLGRPRTLAQQITHTTGHLHFQQLIGNTDFGILPRISNITRCRNPSLLLCLLLCERLAKLLFQIPLQLLNIHTDNLSVIVFEYRFQYRVNYGFHYASGLSQEASPWLLIVVPLFRRQFREQTCQPEALCLHRVNSIEQQPHACV